MDKSYFRISVLLSIIFLLFGVSISPATNTIKNSLIQDSCDIPTWYIGDEWTYTADPVSYSSDSGSFIGIIENFKREVSDIVTITHDDEQIEVYQLDLNGDIIGEITYEALTGDLEGEVTGTSYIRVSDLAEVKTELVSTGIVTILFINRDYELIHTNSFFPPFELYDFPLKLSDQWKIPGTLVSSGSFKIDGLVDEDYYESSIFVKTVQCNNIELISVPAGDFESYEISYSSDTYWYSPEVGNLVKSEVEQGNRDYNFYMDLTLESYSRVAQQIDVTENIDPSEVIIDQEINISGQVKDSNSDPIQNGNINIKIPRIGESWDTNTDDNGYYTLTIEAPIIFDDTPSDGEFGSDGVIVSCSSGDLEGYKIKTLLIIDDFPPAPPSIDGPNYGKINEVYDYKFFATDPDGDNLYYFVDWGDENNSGWIGPYPFGVTLPYKWSEEGTYNIRAKTKDEFHGAESSWSAPFPVSITKKSRNKMVQNSIIDWLLYRISISFPILQYIFRFIQ